MGVVTLSCPRGLRSSQDTTHFADFRKALNACIDIAPPSNSLPEASTGLATAADIAIRFAGKDRKRGNTIDGQIGSGRCPWRQSPKALRSRQPRQGDELGQIRFIPGVPLYFAARVTEIQLHGINHRRSPPPAGLAKAGRSCHPALSATAFLPRRRSRPYTLGRRAPQAVLIETASRCTSTVG